MNVALLIFTFGFMIACGIFAIMNPSLGMLAGMSFGFWAAWFYRGWTEFKKRQ